MCDWQSFWDPEDGWMMDHTLNPAYTDGPMTDPLYPSEACIDQVLADFKVDVAAFEERDGDILPEGAYSVLRGMPRPTHEAGLVLLLSGVRAFFVYDFDDTDRLEVNELTSADFVDDMQDMARRTDNTDLRAAAYNFITDTVHETVPLSSEESEKRAASFNPRTNTLSLGDDFTGILSMAKRLLHEVRHDKGKGHVECVHPNVHGSCDLTIDESYGYEASLAVRFVNGADGGRPEYGYQDVDEVRGPLSVIRHPFQDAEGNLLEEWGGMSGIYDLDLSAY